MLVTVVDVQDVKLRWGKKEIWVRAPHVCG